MAPPDLRRATANFTGSCTVGGEPVRHPLSGASPQLSAALDRERRGADTGRAMSHENVQVVGGFVDAYFERLAEAWTDVRIEIGGYRELGERVVALGVQRGARTSSRIEVAGDFAVVVVVQNSQIVHLDAYDDWTAALDAAGLRV